MRVWFSDNRQRLGWGSHTWGPAPQPSYPMMDTVVWSDRDQTVPMWGWATSSSGILECGPLALRFAAEFLPEGREQERLELHRGEIVCLHPNRSASVIGFADTFAEYKAWVAEQRAKLLRPHLQVAMDLRAEQRLIPPPPTGWRYREWMGRYGYTRETWYTGSSVGGLMEIPTGPTQALLGDHPDAKLGWYYHPIFGWCDGARLYGYRQNRWWAMPTDLLRRVAEKLPDLMDSKPSVRMRTEELENPTLFVLPLGVWHTLEAELDGALPPGILSFLGYHFMWVDLQDGCLRSPVEGVRFELPHELWERVVAKVQE